MAKREIISDGQASPWAEAKSSDIDAGSNVWTIADAFSKLKIFKPLFEADVYEMIAQYGTEDITDIVPPEMIPTRRIEGLFRLKDCLKMVIENANFIIHKKDRKDFENIRRHLFWIESIMDNVYTKEQNHINHSIEVITINEEFFNKILRALQKIKEQINTPLNNASIIFRQSEDMSFEDLLNDIASGG
jgi:hypothetical protein